MVQVVPQNPALFDDTAWNNVTYTNPNTSEGVVRHALKAANCDGFVSKLEGDLEYTFGRNGCKLSGGQRQRLGLAMALLSDPCLLVLEEPTSLSTPRARLPWPMQSWLVAVVVLMATTPVVLVRWVGPCSLSQQSEIP